jgi:hypothetical protein
MMEYRGFSADFIGQILGLCEYPGPISSRCMVRSLRIGLPKRLRQPGDVGGDTARLVLGKYPGLNRFGLVRA